MNSFIPEFRFPSPPFIVHRWESDTKFSIHLQKAPVWSCRIEAPWAEKMLAVLFSDGKDWHLNFYSIRGVNKFVFLNDLSVKSPEEKAEQPLSPKARIEVLLWLATMEIHRILEKSWEAVIQKAFAEISYPEVNDGTDHFRVFANETEAREFAALVGSVKTPEPDGADSESVH